MEPHGAWLACKGHPREVQAAETRVRFLTERYTCAGSAWVRGPLGAIATCKLCKELPETLHHLIIECSVIRAKTQPIIDDLISMYVEDNLPTPSKDDELKSMILNGDCFYSGGSYTQLISKDLCLAAQRLSNRICSIIDRTRVIVIGCS